MSDSVRPHGRQPTRLLCPWDSPGKNTGVGCHFLLQCMKVKSETEVSQSGPTPSDPMGCSYQAPPSMGFSRQEYWSGVPLPSPSKAPGRTYFIDNKTEAQRLRNLHRCDLTVYCLAVQLSHSTAIELFLNGSHEYTLSNIFSNFHNSATH